MVKNRSTLWYTAVLIGWGFDLFYWGKPMGVSFFIHVLLLTGGLIFLSFQEDKKPLKKSLPLVGLILLFSALAFLRAEPFTRVLNHLMTLGLVGLFVLTFRGGRWAAYSLSDYIVSAFRLMINTIALPFNLISTPQETNQEEGREEKPTGWKRSLSYLRGILLALPVLAILAALLASADPIFSEWLADIIELLRLEKLPEYILRLVLISLWTFLTAGLLLYALQKSEEETLIGLDKPWPPRFLGFTETTIILGSVNLLFLSFVTIQFRYFFGGEKNISLQGYTYSEYARRGFGELLAVAFFSLFLFMVLSAITHREKKRYRITFSALTGTLTGLIGVILVSSLQRLALYESAYGFTRLRTYSHLCVLWIGVLFLTILILEIFQGWRFFTLASLAAIAGFVLTMNAVNVDGLITRQNIQRAASEKSALDTNTLKYLSNDAIPDLIQLANSSWLTPKEQQEIAAILACRALKLEESKKRWQSFLVPDLRAETALKNNAELWEDVELIERYSSWVVEIEGDNFFCGYSSSID
jgi:hypothetical protein